MPCGALKKFAVYYAMPIRLCLLFLKVMNLIILLKNKNKKKRIKTTRKIKQYKANIRTDMSANSNIWAKSNTNDQLLSKICQCKR